MNESQNQTTPGDVIMWTDHSSQYAKWFYGKIGVVINKSNNGYVSIRWLEPVEYHGRFTSMSSFNLRHFTAYEEN